jgi:transglutaminase-like putative cysteine protease
VALPQAVTTLPSGAHGAYVRRAVAPPVVRRWLPGGDLGVFQTLGAMRTVARAAAYDPRIQLAARTAAPTGSSPWQARVGILHWLTTHSRFAADPRFVELVRTPPEQLNIIAARGKMPGDCDDAATLGAALAVARGLAARFVVVGFGPTGPATPYSHVYTEVAMPGGGWADLDVQRRPNSPAPTRFATMEV